MIAPHRCLKTVDAPTLDRIHTDSLRLLQEVGVAFDSDEILSHFRYHGARVDGRTAFISSAMVDKALQTCPRGFTMVGRGESSAVRIGEGQQHIAVSPGNGTLYVQDKAGKRRRATVEDFDTITHLCDQSPHIHLVGGVPVEPKDIAADLRPARLVHRLMRHSRKPLIGTAATRREAAVVFDIIEMAHGQKGFLNDHVAIAYSINPASPLCFESLGCETLLAYAGKRQAIFVLPGLMAGVSGPLDLLGLVVQSNAEILAALVCSQVIHPGTPVVYSPGTFMVNLKTIYPLTASPQGNLANMAGLQMAREYYGLPARTMAGMSDAKQVDYQAGAETMQNLVLYTLAGANIINQSLGVMDSLMVTSFEKWILDEEQLARIHCIERGIDQMNSEDPVEAIKAVGIGGNYLMHPDTSGNCRQVWMPFLSDWNSYDDWKKNRESDILLRAHQQYKQRIMGKRQWRLSREVDGDITHYIDSR